MTQNVGCFKTVKKAYGWIFGRQNKDFTVSYLTVEMTMDDLVASGKPETFCSCN